MCKTTESELYKGINIRNHLQVNRNRQNYDLIQNKMK